MDTISETSVKVAEKNTGIPKRYIIVLGTFLLAMLLYVDRILISVAKPQITASLQISDKQMGWVLAIFSLGYALFQVPGGALADKIGPRKTLTIIVGIWSVFTGLTGAAWNFASLMFFRFFFGAGEAGAYPSINRAVFSWIPVKERGTVNGINFSAGRLGAAFAIPLLAILINAVGWQMSFYLLFLSGLLWIVFWLYIFRDDPEQVKHITPEEKSYILANRQAQNAHSNSTFNLKKVLKNKSVISLMGQYFASNFTFFFCLTWLFPYLKTRFELDALEAAYYSAVPLIFGAIGNLCSGFLIDHLYKKGYITRSRIITASIGFSLAALGLLGSIFSYTVVEAIVFLSIAVFGADMTLSPSWAVCSDIGGVHSGKVSGLMNMFGNLGAFITALIFPYLFAWAGSSEPFFYMGVILNLAGVVFWLNVDPNDKIIHQEPTNQLS